MRFPHLAFLRVSLLGFFAGNGFNSSRPLLLGWRLFLHLISYWSTLNTPSLSPVDTNAAFTPSACHLYHYFQYRGFRDLTRNMTTAKFFSSILPAEYSAMASKVQHVIDRKFPKVQHMKRLDLP